MNTRAIALTCALSAAACAGSDSRPAQDPASTNTTAATPLPAAPADYGSPEPNIVSATSSSATSSTSTRTAPTPVPYTPPPAATPSPAPTPAVANNPGVADQTKNADNTKINDRDRHGALTPMDQGNSGAETKITATIRRAMMGDKTLSFTAKNVKVITVGTKVTLRGPVKSDEEKAAVEALARKTAGVTEIDNQLEVKK